MGRGQSWIILFFPELSLSSDKQQVSSQTGNQHRQYLVTQVPEMDFFRQDLRKEPSHEKADRQHENRLKRIG